MKDTFLKLEHWTSGFSMLAACAMLVIAASLGMFQIITRFILETPAEWTEVLIRFSLIWMVFLGIPMAFRQGAMVSVDVLYRWSPPRIQSVCSTGWCFWPLCCLIAVDHLVGLGLRQPRRGAVHERAGECRRCSGLIWPCQWAVCLA